MPAPKVMSGARAKVSMMKGNDPAIAIGVFTNFSYNVQNDVAPAFILGRYGADAIDYTAIEPVTIQASGWRVLRSGPHAKLGAPKMKDILTSDYLKFEVTDRVTGLTVARISKVLFTGFSGGFVARQLSDQSIQYVGLLFEDEDSMGDGEPANASTMG